MHHAFLYIIFVVTVRLRRAIKMPTFTFYGGRKSAESDVTRRRDSNLQRRFSVGHSITTLLQHCLKLMFATLIQHCNAVLALRLKLSLWIVSWNITFNKKTTKFSSFFGLNIFLRNSSPGEFAYIRVTIIAVRIERNANWLFKWRLRRRCSPRISRILVSPLY